jgi:hypothetical protein
MSSSGTGNLYIGGTVNAVAASIQDKLGVGVTTATAKLDISDNSDAPVLKINQLGSGLIVELQRNGIPRLVIDTSGNIGIGTTTPQYALDISGDINFTGALAQNGTTYAGAPGVPDISGVFTVQNGQLVVGSGENGVITTANLTWDSSTNTLVASRYEGSGSGLTELNASNINSGTLAVSYGGTGTTTLSESKLMVGNGTNGIITPANLHWDNTNNRLGVATVDPGYTLDVSGDINFTGTLRQNGTAFSGGGGGGTTDASAINSGTLSVSYGGTGTTTLASGQLIVGNGTGAVIQSSNLTWDNTNGRLGVGITNPANHFQVAGTAAVSTSLVVGDVGSTDSRLDVVFDTSRAYPSTGITSASQTVSGQAYANGTYTVSASTPVVGGEDPWRAFDGNTSTFWSSNTTPNNYTTTDVSSNTYTGHWLQIVMPVSVQMTSLTLTPRASFSARMPSTLVVLGSNNGGTTWTYVTIFYMSFSNNTAQTYQVSGVPPFYTTYRFVATVLQAGASNFWNLADLKINGIDTVLDAAALRIRNRMFYPFVSLLDRTNTAVFVVDSSGNVGVGTTVPSNKLQVTGNAAITTSLYVGDTSGSESRIDVLYDTNRTYPPGNLTTFTQMLSDQTYGKGLYTVSTSSSSVGGEEVWRAFDGNLTTFWSSNTNPGAATTTDVSSNTYTGHWIQVAMPVSMLIAGITLTPRPSFSARMPATLAVLGSTNGGSTWSLVTTLSTSFGSNAPVTYTITGATQYCNAYRFVATALQGGSGSFWNMVEFRMSGTETQLSVPALRVRNRVLNPFVSFFDRNNNNVFQMDSSGNMGVGVSNPGARLDVSHNGSTPTLEVNQTGTGRILEVQKNGTAQIVVDNSGRLGVGRTDPGYSLDVNGDINFTGTLLQNGSAFSGGGGGGATSNASAINSGTLAVSYGGTGTTTATGSGSVMLNTAPTFTGTMTGGSFVGTGSGLTELNASAINSGTLAVSYGGIGVTTLSTNKVMVGNGTSGIITPANLHWDNTNSRLGVATADPGYTLDVSGDINFTGTLRQNGTAFSSGGGGGGTTDASAINSGILSVSYGGTGTTTATGYGSVMLNTAPTFTGTMTGGSFVGTGSGLTELNASNINNGTLAVSYGGIGVTTLSGNKLVVGNGTSGVITPANLHWDNANNRLGVATVDPGYTLDVSGDINFTGTLRQNGTVFSGGGGGTTDASTITSGTLAVSYGGTGTSTLASRQILVGNGANAVLQSSNLVWDSSTNALGIGTTNPLATLHVAGNQIVGTNVSYASYRTLSTKLYLPASSGTINGVNITALNRRTRASAATAIHAVSNWTARASVASAPWNSVCWSPELSLFCAVSGGGDPCLMTSPDGIHWTARTPAAFNAWSSVCWSPELGIFCAVGFSGSGNRVMTSPDGINWTSRNAASDLSWFSVCWSSELGIFCAVAGSGAGLRVMTSPDGTTWTSRSPATGSAWNSVCWSPELSLFCAVAALGSNNNVMTSPDGINWTSRTSGAPNQWLSVCWSPELSLFCAVGQSGTGNRVMTSPDGITWTARSSAADLAWYSVCWSPELSLFCAVGTSVTENGIMTSPDGINWTLRAPPYKNGWTSVCWSSELSIFCAVAGSGGDIDYFVMTSAIGLAAPKSAVLANPSHVTVNQQNGFVGIGTTNPTHTLHVAGDINFTGTLLQNGTAFSGGGGGGTTNASNINSGTLAVSYGGTGTTTATGSGSVMLNTAPTFTGTMTGGSFVGTGSGLTELNASNINSGTLAVSYGGTGVTTLSANKVMVGNGTNIILTPANLHWDNTNSRLGVATVDPGYTLDVAGDINFTGTLRQNGTAFSGGGGGSSQWTTSGSDILYNTGNVGIGVTTVGARLDVSHNGTTPAVEITTTGTKKLQFNNDTTTNRHIVLSEVADNEHQFIGIGTNTNTMRFQVDATTDFFRWHAATSATTSNLVAELSGTGDLSLRGDVAAFQTLSDARLKKDVEPLSGSIDVVRSLRPVTFRWRDDIFNEAKRDKPDVGFIAQEVEQTIPLAVGDFSIDGMSYKKIEHNRILPYLVGAVQELIRKMDGMSN